MTDMIAAASKTPSMIERNAFLRFIWMRPATIDPVHAPVPGKGIPTNSVSPNRLYFSIVSLCLSTFERNIRAKRSVCLFDSRKKNEFFYEEQNKGNRDQISKDTNDQCFEIWYVKQRGCNETATQLENRHNRYDEYRCFF